MEYTLADFNSPLWDKLSDAYGNIKGDLEPLPAPEPVVQEWEKCRYIHKEMQSDYRLAFANVSEQLMYQGSLYSAKYLALPYLVSILEA